MTNLKLALLVFLLPCCVVGQLANSGDPRLKIGNTTAIAVDAAGNVYVTGKSYGGSSTNLDYATIKYNSTGAQQWVARYNGSGSSTDEAKAIAVDNSGNVYVTGSDYATIKYNSAGVEQWAVRYGPGISSGYATALALDGFGNVYVTGRSYDSFTDYDYATIKYNAAGTRQWAARYDGPGNDEDEAEDLKLDNFGNSYVTEKSKGNGSDYDFATVKYNPSGIEQWAARYNNPSNGIDEAIGLGLDSFGNIYVSGTSKGFSWSVFTTIKYSQGQFTQRTLTVHFGHAPGEKHAAYVSLRPTENCKILPFGKRAWRWLRESQNSFCATRKRGKSSASKRT
jgi:hypothetical protein